MKTVRHAGNINMRGKLTKELSCRCCTVRNLKKLYEMKRRKIGFSSQTVEG